MAPRGLRTTSLALCEFAGICGLPACLGLQSFISYATDRIPFDRNVPGEEIIRTTEMFVVSCYGIVCANLEYDRYAVPNLGTSVKVQTKRLLSSRSFVASFVVSAVNSSSKHNYCLRDI